MPLRGVPGTLESALAISALLLDRVGRVVRVVELPLRLVDEFREHVGEVHVVRTDSKKAPTILGAFVLGFGDRGQLVIPGDSAENLWP